MRALLLAALLVEGAAEGEDLLQVMHEDENSTARWLTGVLGDDDLEDSLCGSATVSLDDDVVRRFCLRQCRLESNRQIRPTFVEWEGFCYDTADMDPWDNACMAFFACRFGCSVWGGDRRQLLNQAPSNRRQWLSDNKADMYAPGVTAEKGCQLEKCNAYCARDALDTCRRTQYLQKCVNAHTERYGCDVRCDGAAGRRHVVLLASLAALLGRGLRGLADGHA